MISTKERDDLVILINDLTTLNKIYNEHAKKIENREGIWWKMFSEEEIRKRAEEYDEMIIRNNKIIEFCFNKLFSEFNS